MNEQPHDGGSDVFRLSLASADDVRRLAFAEVLSPDLFLPRTRRPAPRGLLCETIFGRDGDWECDCGRLRAEENVGYVCARCDQPVRHLRSTRFGRVELATPIIHPLFTRELGLLLNYTAGAFQQVLIYMPWVVVERGDTPLRVGQLILEGSHNQIQQEYGDRCRLAMGGDACRQLLEKLDLHHLRVRLAARLEEEQRRRGGPRRERLAHLRARRRIVETICRAAPEDPNEYASRLVFDWLLVIPPAQRLPREQGGTRVTAEINHLYGSIINHNNRLRKLVELNAPEVIVRNERRMLQLAVGALFHNCAQRWPVLDGRRRPLPSLADRLRDPATANLLSRRVDYSARAVVVPDPALPRDHCGLPECIAVELFRPLLLARLTAEADAELARRARELLELLRPRLRGGLDEAFLAGMRLYRELITEIAPGHRRLLGEVMRGRRLVVAGRGMGLPALAPVLVEGKAVRVHPGLAGVLGVRFRGECVRLHLPLSNEAQREAEALLECGDSSPLCPFFSSPGQNGQTGVETPAGQTAPMGPAELFAAARRERRRRLEEGARRDEAEELTRRLSAAMAPVVDGGAPVGLRAALAVAGAAARLPAALSQLRRLLEGRAARSAGRERLGAELQAVFEEQGVEIDERHFHVIAARLLTRDRRRGISALVRRGGWLSALATLGPVAVLRRAALAGAAEDAASLHVRAMRGGLVEAPVETGATAPGG
jgi:DNA-directed RNA polymerase beta' subunit